MSRYGNFPGHNELLEMYKSWSKSPKGGGAALAEAMGTTVEQLQEGTGGPEGRADFPLFLLSFTRHSLRQGFRADAAQWGSYMGVEDAKDFRQHTTSQLNGMTGMGPVPEYDEYPRLKTSEEMGPSFAVGKHGGIYGITYEMVVNDEPGEILRRTPEEMGRMNAAYIASVVAALIEANGNWIDGIPFFSTTARAGLPGGNEVTGAGAEPSEDNLVTQIAAMRNSVTADGLPMSIKPGKVLTKDVRVQLVFNRILRSQQTGTTSPSTSSTTFDKGTYNAAQGLLSSSDPVILDPYLKDPNDWILFGETNPGRPAFLIAFLRGQREPFIGMLDPGVRSIGGGSRDPYTMDFDEMKMKLRMVFGVAQGDPRAARRARRA